MSFKFTVNIKGQKQLLWRQKRVHAAIVSYMTTRNPAENVPLTNGVAGFFIASFLKLQSGNKLRYSIVKINGMGLYCHTFIALYEISSVTSVTIKSQKGRNLLANWSFALEIGIIITLNQ